jgi:hypothetical protein
MVGMGLIEPTPIKSSAPSREKSPKLAEIRVSKNVGVWFGSAAWLQNIRNRNMLKQQTMALKCLKCLKSALGLINSANIYVYIYIIYIYITYYNQFQLGPGECKSWEASTSWRVRRWPTRFRWNNSWPSLGSSGSSGESFIRKLTCRNWHDFNKKGGFHIVMGDPIK